MKKLIAAGLACALTLTVGGTVFAHHQGRTEISAPWIHCDGDGDGLYGRCAGRRNMNFTDEDGDGVCDNWIGCQTPGRGEHHVCGRHHHG